MLPEIEKYIIKRPGLNVPKSHFIPNPQESAFWDSFYSETASEAGLAAAIEDFSEHINPYFGNYGFRWHPVAKRPNYFHVGIDVHMPSGTPIMAVADGLLEYSGYADVNGRYIVMRHPGLQTADGFVLHSLYMHCENLLVKFSMTQKLIREFVSKKLSCVNVILRRGQQIATVGGTGNKLQYNPHLHLQFELVRNDKRVAIDPLRLYGLPAAANLTAYITDMDDFLLFHKQHAEALKSYDRFL